MKRKLIKKTGSGYLTVYLTFTMAVLMSLCLALIEGVRANAIRVETECVTDIGLNSILAEYHRELFNRYNLFAVDSSYGTSAVGLEIMEQHLQGYMERNLSLENVFLADYIYRDFLAISVDSLEMTAASILTDGEGAVFRKRAAEAVKDDCNLTLLHELQQWIEVVEDNGLRETDVASQKREIDKQIQEYDEGGIQISKIEGDVALAKNPTEGLERIRREGILKYVVKDVNTLSTKRLQLNNLIGERMRKKHINKGNLPIPELTDTEQLSERFFFQEYLMHYLGHYGKEKENAVLDYQIEYLLAGSDTDVTNLKKTADTICAVREAANAMYLFSDEEKCAEAEVVALLTASLLQMPDMAPVLKTALLLGWAYAESLYDVEVLLGGGRIPLMKDKGNWHYDIRNALQFGHAGTGKSERGLSYEEYLRLMMMFVEIDTLTARAMDMVEADIRRTPGNAFFRLDNCYDRVEFCVRVKSRYGYDYEISRRKEY